MRSSWLVIVGVVVAGCTPDAGSGPGELGPPAEAVDAGLDTSAVEASAEADAGHDQVDAADAPELVDVLEADVADAAEEPDGPTCAADHADCNGIAVDGCEQSLHDPENCGSCGYSCGKLPNLVAWCVVDRCTFCPINSWDCKGTGNCIAIPGNHDNCGACGVVCGPTQTCQAGQCR